jgi:hypothetical protein
LFSDNYVIPLAKKLEECRVFGVASDECLNYALENRKEWAMKGQSIVQQMTERIKHTTKFQDDGSDPILQMEVISSQPSNAPLEKSNESNVISNMLRDTSELGYSSVSHEVEEDEIMSA